MRILLFIPLLALFAVPWGLEHVLRDPVSWSNPYPSAPAIPAPDDSAEPLRVESATTREADVATEPRTAVAQPAAAAATQRVPAAPAAATTTPSAATTTESTATSAVPAAASAPAPSSTGAPGFVALVEEEVLRLMNLERSAAGLHALAPSAALRAIAAGHSVDMLANDYFSHENLQGCSSSCRATNAGYRWQTIGENIYMMSGYRVAAARAAEMVVAGWMNSPGHRANILGESFAESGVGAVSDGTNVYVTALYGTRR